jgi:calcineurin-like phosphoesterase family protein
MIAHVFSDLHCEYPANRKAFIQQFDLLYGKSYNLSDEVLFLAGDIGSLASGGSGKLHEFLEYVSRPFGQTYYVPGNHEMYDTSINIGLSVLDSWNIPKVNILRPGKVAHLPDGRTVVGGTLWFPEGWDDRDAMYLSDFRTIRNIRYEAPRAHRDFIGGVIPEITRGSVVLSHHCPHPGSIPPEFVGDPGNWFFNVNLEQYILDKKPALWIHGHTHAPMDYKVGETRVYCNPKGYQSEGRNPDFWRRTEIRL